MRAKAGEKKRYSLRNIQRKDFRSEEEVLAAVRKESKKAYEELHSSPLWKNDKEDEKSGKFAPSGSTKRKRSKPEKTLNNNKRVDIAKQEDIAKELTLKGITDEEEQTKHIDEQENKETVSSPVPCDDDTNENEITDETPVYYALGHAYECKSSSECAVPKCLIAKQFIEHFSSCNTGTDKCNICKAMDIMVRKHAQICEKPLEKCPIPKCDKVRLRVWFEFSGLLRHAKTCHEKDCDILNNINIKFVFLHPLKCDKNETCKTRTFVKQLCEHYHHQQAYSNELREEESYPELLKRKKQEVERQNQLLQIQQLLAACNVPNISLQSHNLMNSLSGGQNLNVPGPLMCANPWGTSLLPMTNTSQYFYPNNAAMPYSSFAFDPNAASQQQMYQANAASQQQMYQANAASQQQMYQSNDISEQYDTQLENTTDVSDASISYPIPGDEEEHTVDEFLGAEQQVDLYQVSSPTVDEKEKNDILSYTPSSPTRKMYYKLWSEKAADDCLKNALLNLSPDLKMLSRGDERQFLSPVNDNRASYSEIQSQPNEYILPDSQDDETEEDPLPPSCRKSRREMSRGKQHDKVEDLYTEQQSEWCKIDFVKQHVMGEMNVKMETVGQSVESNADSNPNTFTRELSVNDEKPPNPIGHNIGTSLTQIEQTFLDIMKEQKLAKAP